MDYTAITVALISLIGVIWQGLHNGNMIKKNNIKSELEKTEIQLEKVAKAQMYQSQDRLMFLCTEYIKRGYIEVNELKLLTNMYNSYRDIDGNDFITALFERVKELPVHG